MKTTVQLNLTVLLLFFLTKVYGDIIPDNSHFVWKCATITNLADYPEISLIGAVDGPYAQFNYIISDSVCLTTGHRHNNLSIYAALNSYLIGKDVEDMDLPSDENVLISNIQIKPSSDYFDNSIPIDSISEFYRIAGFTQSNVILYKWKEVIKFIDDSPDSVENYEFIGTQSAISQFFPTLSDVDDHTQYGVGSRLYPNPNFGNLLIKMVNNYQGIVNIEIYSSNGKLLKKTGSDKAGIICNLPISTADLNSGTYIVRLSYGEVSESKKLIIN